MPGISPTAPTLRELDGAHFIGIGGVGMSSIAITLLGRGLRVSGSDACESDTTARLRQLGARVCVGHAPEHLADARLVVVSSAIAPDNPELLAARQRGLPVLHRSLALGALLAASRSVGVAGAHGKTTTTMMTGAVLIAAGFDPSVLVGGWVREFDGTARVGHGDVIVAEVDESDGSFLNLQPDLAAVVNVDFDHPDYFADIHHVRDAFVRFLNQPRAGAPACAAVPRAAIVDADDAGVQAILPRIERRVVRCSLADPSADMTARVEQLTAAESRFSVRYQGASLGLVRLPVGGEHNVRNALIALAAGLLLGGEAARCVSGLEQFRGVRRRFEFRGAAGGVSVYDDYGHHPREIEATLAVAAQLRAERGGRLIAVFQPHRYTRTQSLADGFGRAFRAADAVILTDVYSAGDPPIPGVDGRLIAEAVKRDGHPDISYCPQLAQLAEFVARRLRPGDVVLTIGAGDITIVGPEILERLGAREEGKK